VSSLRQYGGDETGRQESYSLLEKRLFINLWTSLSPAALERTNNKIKAIKRQAYGFLKLKIMAIHLI
jgi:hypothetical protein